MIEDIKAIKTEALKANRICIPEITAVYDLLSRRSDGTITPQAPIVVSGYNLKMQGRKNVRFCLIPTTEYIRVIEVGNIHMYSDTKIIIDIPELEAGEYFPAIRMPDIDGDDFVYIFPVSWIVRPYDRMNEIYRR